MSTNACFENIIGLSRTDCECVEDRPVSAGTSNSGLYLDELEGLSIRLADTKRDCGESSLWTMMARARENAIADTTSDLLACLSREAAVRRRSGSAIVGDTQKSTASAISLRAGVHGMTIQLAKVKGGTFRVTRIGAAFKTSGTITVHVYDRYGEDPIASYTVNHDANRPTWTTLPLPLDLSMDHRGTDNPRYWFVFEPGADLRAMNTLMNCNCGTGGPTWNIDRPQYQSIQQNGGQLWMQWAMAAGTQGTTIADRESWGTSNTTNGLLLDVEFDCDQVTTICPDVPNYQTDGIQRVIAHAVRFKAGANLITSILSSTAINRYTMTAGEQLDAMRKQYLKEYEARVFEYLCPTIAEEANINRYGDCLVCKDRWGMSRSTIQG